MRDEEGDGGLADAGHAVDGDGGAGPDGRGDGAEDLGTAGEVGGGGGEFGGRKERRGGGDEATGGAVPVWGRARPASISRMVRAETPEASARASWGTAVSAQGCGDGGCGARDEGRVHHAAGGRRVVLPWLPQV
ncbi:hypothetical protein Pen01_41620 [Phytomonospora endophytica]|nr:hypothetical protein Pen01_41620 [Phytomonospora endophytica]